MSQAPQTPPPIPPPSAPTAPREELRCIASRQKWVCICLLIYFAAFIARFLGPAHLQPLLGIVALGACVLAAVFVFMLAIKLYGTGVGVLLGILTLVPLLGLIPLLIVNAKATSVLKKNGIKVGLLGADLKSI